MGRAPTIDINPRLRLVNTSAQQRRLALLRQILGPLYSTLTSLQNYSPLLASREKINLLIREVSSIERNPLSATRERLHSLAGAVRLLSAQAEERSRDSNLSPTDKQTLRDASARLRQAATELETIETAKETESRPEAVRTPPPANNNAAVSLNINASPANDNALSFSRAAQSQLIGGQLTIGNHEFRITFDLRQIMERIQQHQGERADLARELVRGLATSAVSRTRSGRLNPEAEATAQLLLSLVVEKLVRENVSTDSRSGNPINQKSIETIINEINQQLQRVVANVHAAIAPQGEHETLTNAGRERLVEDRLAERRVETAPVRNQAPENSATIMVTLTRTNIDIQARLQQTSLVETARRIIGTAIADNPNSGARAISHLLDVASHNSDRTSTQQQSANRFVHEVFSPMATTRTWLTAPVVQEIIRSIAAAPSAVVVGPTAARVAIGQMILAQAPNAALPDLLAAQAKATTNGAREILAEIIREVARTQAGGRYVLTALAANDKTLAASPLRNEIMVEAARGYRIRANQNRNAGTDTAASTSLIASTPQERLDRLAVMAARNNVAQITDKDLTAGKAESLLKFVVSMERVAQRMGNNNLAVLENKAAAKPVRQPVRSVASRFTPAAANNRPAKAAAALDKTVAARRALTEMLDAQKTFDWSIPPEVYDRVGAYYSAMAGLSSTQMKAVLQVPANIDRPADVSRPDVLNQVLKIMIDKTAQAQAVNSINRVIPSPAANIVAGIAPSLVRVYGLLFARLMADMERTENLRKVLAKKGYLGILVKAVDNGHFEAVIGIIDVIALQINNHSQEQPLDEEAISDFVEQALDDIQQKNALVEQFRQPAMAA
ncbi:hypothetical protein HZB07_03760 [Candidatus Saganbacteria bacterium]|nr:hypothetical protein [Candidatus Saganbacteria bacterium]